MEQPKEYYAFISYKREDEKWARWLQQKLESYKLPTIIRKERPDLPKYIRPIFRDGTDLSGGILTEKLRQDLLRSRYLIVICSPNATKSKWVNKEAQTFIDEGWLKYIVPFIVAGTPHASDATDECFPRALQDIPAEKELLGINVREVGKNIAFIRLVATMLNVRFDTLWQRHRRNLIRKRIVYGCVAVLFALFGLFVWDYNRTTYEYYADWVDCYGVPKGIVPLNVEQVAHRNRNYQFEYRRIPLGEPNAYSWRVVKVKHVDSNFQPQDITDTEWKDRYAIQTIEYIKNTSIVRQVIFCDKQENVLLRHRYSEIDGIPATAADFGDPQEQRGSGFVGSNTTSLTESLMDAGQQKSNISRYIYERDEHGHIIRQTYHSSNDVNIERSAVSDGDGIFGRRFFLDSLGRRIQMIYLGQDGRPTTNKHGEGGRKYKYDLFGNINQITYVDVTGNPTMNELHHAIYVGISDPYGNIVEENFFDVDSVPCMTKCGFARRIARCDLTKNWIEISFYDTCGLPCACSDGYAKMEMKSNKFGNEITVSYFNLDGKPCFNNDK